MGMAVQKEIDYEIDFGDLSVTAGITVFSEAFDEAYSYDGDDLGCRYSREETRFALWAPTAGQAELLLYDSWDSAAPSGRLPMIRGERGVWRAVAAGDQKGRLYTYRVLVGVQWNEAPDPYATAVAINGDRSAVIDLMDTQPDRWTKERPPFDHAVDAVIYEVHIRDLTIHPESGIRQKGLYLGACETGTTGPDGIPTGLDHIRSLGVTHVQLLPVYDYSTESVDETRPGERYNWGYDPKNYNVPEGSYATNPYDPAVRIRELKTLVQTLHDQGLRVIMDVVYNHVYDGYRVHFSKLVPGYYLRYRSDGRLSDGSGCGNDCATERRMMRKYIVESVLYWAREYHMDGFRFDLMGLMDLETMNELRQRLDELDPTIVMLGEGWVMPTELAEEKRANQQNARKLPGVGQFNDGLRDALKGSTFVREQGGFAGGGHGLEREVCRGIAGAISYSAELAGFAAEPVQSVAYVEAHDNHTLWDKLAMTHPHEEEAVRRRRHMLASAVVLTSQGMAFLHAGQEFMRTKNGHGNSYKSPDPINWMDWRRAAEEGGSIEQIRRLIALRRAHPAFRLRSAEDIRRHLFFEPSPSGSVAYTLRNHANGDPALHLFVIHNVNTWSVQVNIPLPGLWKVIFGDGCHGGFDRLGGGLVEIKGISTVVLAADEKLAFYPV